MSCEFWATSRPKLRLIFASYREWAKPVAKFVATHPRVELCTHVSTKKQLDSLIAGAHDQYDLVVLCGWSDPPAEWATKLITIVSEHPAESDRYSPGTPLQNQIIDGLTETKHRIVRVGYPELSPRLYSHEVPMSLKGDMDAVLSEMTQTSIQLFDAFLCVYPNVTWHEWPPVHPDAQMRRREPSDSRLEFRDMPKMGTVKLYDFIRSLTDPYPNAYVEDSHGRLYFTGVEFEPRSEL